MKGMDRALEALKVSIADASKKEENLRLIGDAERGAVNAKNSRPTEMLNDAKDDATKAEIMTKFRKDLLEVLKALIDAEVATMDGKTAEAKTAIDHVITLRDKGHKDLKVDEKKKGGEGGPGGGRGGDGAPRGN
jgi:soluble cytochrome b562